MKIYINGKFYEITTMEVHEKENEFAIYFSNKEISKTFHEGEEHNVENGVAYPYTETTSIQSGVVRVNLKSLYFSEPKSFTAEKEEIREQ